MKVWTGIKGVSSVWRWMSPFLLPGVWESLAWGQNEEGAAPGAAAQLPDLELPNLWLVGLQMLFWLVVVIGLIFISIWLMKKLLGQGRSVSRQKPIHMLFQEPIGPGRSVCLVQVLDQIHVIGVTNTQISYLSTLGDDEIDLVNQWMENESLVEQHLRNGFQSFLQRLGQKK